jgi:hypothetical protein
MTATVVKICRYNSCVKIMFRIYTVLFDFTVSLFPRREAFFYFDCHAVICYGIKSTKIFLRIGNSEQQNKRKDFEVKVRAKVWMWVRVIVKYTFTIVHFAYCFRLNEHHIGYYIFLHFSCFVITIMMILSFASFFYCSYPLRFFGQVFEIFILFARKHVNGCLLPKQTIFFENAFKNTKKRHVWMTIGVTDCEQSTHIFRPCCTFSVKKRV